MKPIVLLAGLGGAVALVAVAASAKPSGNNLAGLSKLAKWRTVHGLPLPSGVTVNQYENAVQAWSTHNGQLTFPLATPGPLTPQLDGWWKALHQGFLNRDNLLPSDAKPVQDGYSTELYWVAIPEGIAKGSRIHVDQWGRRSGGPTTDPLGTLLTAAGYALPFVPGIGPAASAAIAYAIAVGKGESQKDAIIDAGRAAVPGGPVGKMAYDMAVGSIVEHKPIDQSAKDAFFQQYPEAKVAYDQGKEYAKKAGF